MIVRVYQVAQELKRLDAPWEAVRPTLVAAKRDRMRAGSYPFLRASAPLFFRRLREELEDATQGLVELARWLSGDGKAAADRIAWCAGDVHVENFGAYKATDGRERFGLNDFDDAILAPIEVDVLRHLTSTLVASRAAGQVTGAQALDLARRLLDAYADTLDGKLAAEDPGELESPLGPVRDLLLAASEKSRTTFLQKRAPAPEGHARRFVASERYRPLVEPERGEVLSAFEKAVLSLGERASERKGFYEPIDVAARTAGLGSLGCGRYAILVEGKAAADPDERDKERDRKARRGHLSGNVLLELKEAKPASLARHGCPLLQTFEDEAARVIAGQVALRGEVAPHLGRTTLHGQPYYLRRLSHREERIDLLSMGASVEVLGPIVEVEARSLASAHARSRASLGKGPLAQPTAAEREGWLLLACRLAGSVEGDYLAFASAPA